MKNFYLALIACLLVSSNMKAQSTVVINTGTAGTPAYNAGPIYRSSAGSGYDASRYAYLYTQSELAAAGIYPGSTINQLGWSKNSTDSTTGAGIFRIYMKTSSATDFSAASETWANLNTGATLAYENLSQQISGLAAPNYITFTLTTPFVYTGGSLEISTEWDISAVSGNPTTGDFDWLWSTVADRIYGTGDLTLPPITTLSSTTNSISTIDDRRPFLQVTFMPPTGTDASVTLLTSQMCAGTYPVQLVLSNFGTVNLDSVSLQWSVNNVTQTPYTWLGSLATGQSDTVTLGNYTFSTGTAYTIQSYLTNVNGGGSDSNTNNDTATVQNQTGLVGNYTIDSTLATSVTNFRNFTDFVFALNNYGVCGPVVVDVKPGYGPYSEQVVLSAVAGMSAINTVTIHGHGETLQFASANSALRGTIELNGGDHFIIDSLHLVANGTYGYGVHLTNNADSNTISNCTLDINLTSTSTNFAGIVMSATFSATGTGATGCDDNVITGNTINGGYYGITLVANGNTEMVYGNVVSNNKINDTYSYGIYLNGNNNTLIENNDINRSNRSSVTNFYGIYMTSPSRKTTVTKNRIHDTFNLNTASTSASNGIYLTSCDAVLGSENLFTNNLLYNFNNAGTQYGIYNSSSDYAKFYHNTISLDDQTTTCVSCITRGYYYVSSGVLGGVFVDNNISITRTGGGAAYGMYYGVVDTVPVSDYNNVYVATPGSTSAFGYYSAAAQLTLADWQTASGKDSNSLSLTPLFSSPITGNFAPSNPALNDSGTYVGVTDDIIGTPRSSTTPDIGAYEFDISSSDAGVTAITTGNCAGTDSVFVTVQNFGTDTLHTVTVYGTINGNSLPNSGNTFTVHLASAETAIINLGQVTYVTGNAYSVVAFTSSPNGGADGNAANDTLTHQVQLSLAGTYTINSAFATGSGNYQTLTDAANDLNTLGICGPVVFNVVTGSGPYVNQQLELGNVSGTSSVNTITFNGNGETISFASTVSTSRAGIRLNGTDYVTVDSFIIEATGTYGFGIQLLGSANNNIIRNNAIYTDTSSTSTNYAGIVVSNSTSSATSSGSTAENNRIENNTVKGGYYGVTLVGTSTTVHSPNNVVTGNKMTNYYYYGVYSYYQDSVNITRNIVEQRDTPGTSGYGIYPYYNDFFTVSKNKIVTNASSTNYGIYAYYCDASDSLANDLSNNFIVSTTGTGATYGIYPYNNTHTNVYHNSVHIMGGSSTAGRAVYINSSTSGNYGFINVKNNIGVNTGPGYAVEVSNGAVTQGYLTSMDNNNWKASGAVMGRYNNNDYADIAAWKAGTLLDSNSISMDPLFASPTDLHVSLNFLNDRGAAGLGIADDIDGDIRCPNIACAGTTLRPDIGADEFLGAPILVDMGVVTLANPVQTSCYSDSETVTVTIKNFNSQTIDFSVNPVTVSVSVTGQDTAALTPVVLSTGTLAADSSLLVTIVTNYDMSAPGNYIFTMSVNESSDANPLNDTAVGTIQFAVGTIANTYAQTCSGSGFELKLDDYTGSMQWQSYDAANSVWINETGTGFDSVAYVVTPVTTTIYRALVCGTFTSAPDTIEPVLATPPTTTNDTICGAGTATLTAQGTGTGVWYDALTGGNVVAVNDTLNVAVTGDTVFYAENSITLTGGSGLLKITELDLGGTDAIEIQNMSSQPINTTGWVVAISDDYTLINSPNTTLWNLPAVINPGEVLYKTDGTTNAWGSNIFWNPGSGGWAIIIDNLGNVVDLVAWDWTTANLATFNNTINGFNVTLANSWAGGAINSTGLLTAQSLNRQGNSDNNDSTDFVRLPKSLGVQNAGLSSVFAGGSCASSRVPAYITVLSKPQVNLGADTTQCEGTVLLDAQNPGDTYLWSTGATSQTILADTISPYSVTVTRSNGCTGTDAVNVNIAPYPTVNLGADTTVCGNSIFLTTSNAANTFQWSTGASLPFITVTNSGNYSVTVTTPSGCAKSDSVNIAFGVAITVSLGNDTAQCDGSFVLDAGHTGSTYLWNTGATTQTLTVDTTGSYSVMVTGNDGCKATDTANVTFYGNPTVTLTVADTICSNASAITLTAQPTGGTFTGTGVTGSSFNPAGLPAGFQPIMYTYTDNNGCSANATDSIQVVICTGINETIVNLPIKIFPNPSNGLVYVDISALAGEKIQISTYSYDGKLVANLNTVATANFITVNLQDKAAGLYLVKIVYKETTVIKQIVIQ